MKNFKYLLLVVLTVVSGFIGGVFSNYFFERSVVAQESESRKIIEAQEFRVVDKDGKLVAILGDFFDQKELFIFDDKGNRRISLYSGRISMTDEDGNLRVALKDSVGIGIADENGKPRISLMDSGTMVIYDENEKGRISLMMFEDQPSISIRDENCDRAVLGCIGLETIKTGSTQKTSESSLTLFDKEGKVFWRVPND